ncbi:hypothetical protein NP493_1070g00046 [Ridgeia piscesae]|uniref:Uncharacterized protein n=1 Tax=Ridgeia piscesae TaxID=27915 RepID=A0AAD9NIL8_RIDPI|nr:hypothetical protein NP493_1070g00046 [Ridgeia piscesae]
MVAAKLQTASEQESFWLIYTVHGTRNTEHGTRNTEHGTRNTEHGTRYTVHGTRALDGDTNFGLFMTPSVFTDTIHRITDSYSGEAAAMRILGSVSRRYEPDSLSELLDYPDPIYRPTFRALDE